MVKCLPLIDSNHNPCESFILAKHQMDRFPNVSNYHATTPLKLVHPDLCGPMQTQFIGWSFYFLTFINDFSKMNCVYFMKNKYDTFSKFGELKVMEKTEWKVLKGT